MWIIYLLVFTALSICIVAEKPNKVNSTAFVENFERSNITRRGRQLQIGRIEIPFAGTEIKKQILRIPSSVSRVKLVGAQIIPGPRKTFLHVKRTPIKYIPHYGTVHNVNSQESDNIDYQTVDSPLFQPNEIKRQFKKYKLLEPYYNGNYEDANFDLGYLRNEDPTKIKILKTKRKIGGSSENFKKFEINEFPNLNPRIRIRENEPTGYYQFNHIEPSLHPHLKLQPSGFYGATMQNSPKEVSKQSVEKQMSGKYYEKSYLAPVNGKMMAFKGRKKILNPQYTTHNPHVAKNFGLSDLGSSNSFHQYTAKVPFSDSISLSYGAPTEEKYKNTIASAAEHIVNAVPGLSPGIKIIQPPQLGNGIGHHLRPSRLISPSSQSQEHIQRSKESQKATIRDILEQDCPDYEVMGYCESPPRYPMHQISIVVKKCKILMDVMTTHNVAQQENDIFSERSDLNLENTQEVFISDSKEPMERRSTMEGTPACESDFILAEPGYAKEVITGRWFVIVQHPETVQQRITTDSCKNPGKPCGGLTDLKCSGRFTNSNNFTDPFTKCIQKYAYHKLISWDPDAPDACPRMRPFKFPSACVCHVGVV